MLSLPFNNTVGTRGDYYRSGNVPSTLGNGNTLLSSGVLYRTLS